MKLLRTLLSFLLLTAGVYSGENNFKEVWLEWLKEDSINQELPIYKWAIKELEKYKNVVNDSLVLIELRKHKIPFEKDFLLQIKKESGNYKSKLSLEFNNITGMKLARQRKTLATGTNKYEHASFKCWRECIADLKLFIEYSPPKQNETFLQFMKRRGYNYTFK